MGFEVIFKFYDKKADGTYDTGNLQSFTKHVGAKVDDVPLEKLASVIMRQLARRDIWVLDKDLEVYEFTKRRISFKETKGGVIIKNKKFLLDDGAIQIVGVTEPHAEVNSPPSLVREPDEDDTT